MTYKLTLNTIRAQDPCANSWAKLLKSLNKTEADDTVVTIEHLLESNGINDTLWVINKCMSDMRKERFYMAADFAESVLHIYEKQCPDDSRVRDCIQAIKDYANSKIHKKTLGRYFLQAFRDYVDSIIYKIILERPVNDVVDAIASCSDTIVDRDDRRIAAWSAAAAAANASIYFSAARDTDVYLAARISYNVHINANNYIDAAKAAKAARDTTVCAARAAEKEKQKGIIFKYFGSN